MRSHATGQDDNKREREREAGRQGASEAHVDFMGRTAVAAAATQLPSVPLSLEGKKCSCRRRFVWKKECESQKSMTAAVHTHTIDWASERARPGHCDRAQRGGTTYDGGHTMDEAARHRRARAGERGECKKCQSSSGRTGVRRGREGKNGSSFPMMIPVYNRRALALRCCLQPAPMYPYLDKPVADRGHRQAADAQGGNRGGRPDRS